MRNSTSAKVASYRICGSFPLYCLYMLFIIFSAPAEFSARKFCSACFCSPSTTIIIPFLYISTFLYKKKKEKFSSNQTFFWFIALKCPAAPGPPSVPSVKHSSFFNAKFGLGRGKPPLGEPDFGPSIRPHRISLRCCGRIEQTLRNAAAGRGGGDGAIPRRRKAVESAIMELGRNYWCSFRVGFVGKWGGALNNKRKLRGSIEVI